MKVLLISSVVKPGFSLEPWIDGDRLVVKFCGNGDMTAIAVIASFLKALHTEAMRLEVHEVVLDFRELYFMNSSCFKAFVSWIDTVKNEAKGYQIRFLTEPDLQWQRRSLEALRRLAVGVVSVEPVSPGSGR